MKPLFLLFICMVMLGCGSENQDTVKIIDTNEDPLIAYQKQKNVLDPIDLYELVQELLHTSTSEEVLIKVIEDAIDLVDVRNQQMPNGGHRDGDPALNSTKIAGALPELITAMQDVQKRFSEDHPAVQEAAYAEANLLLLSNQMDEAVEKFKEARQNRWTSVDFSFEDTLVNKMGFIDGTATLYNIAIDDTYTDPEKRNLVDTLLTPLYLYSKSNPGFSAIQTVFPKLNHSTDHPEINTITKALCLMIDRKVDQSHTLLNDLDQSLKVEIENGNEVFEYNNIPVFQVVSAYFANRPKDEIRQHLKTFISRNQNNLTHVVHTCSALVRWRESILDNRNLSLEITSFFNDAGFYSDPILMRKIDPHELAHLMDLHLIRIWYGNFNQEDSQELAERIVANFFPETRGGSNAMWVLANKYFQQNENGKAVDCLIRTMLECPYDMWVNQAEQRLLSHWIKTETPMENALKRVRDILQLSSPTHQEKIAELEGKIKKMYK